MKLNNRFSTVYECLNTPTFGVHKKVLQIFSALISVALPQIPHSKLRQKLWNIYEIKN